jgi:hypothetical protein
MGRKIAKLPVHTEQIDSVVFRPVFRGGAWEIDVLFPNSVIEHIKWFKSKAEADHWIASDESSLWLQAKGYLQ